MGYPLRPKVSKKVIDKAGLIISSVGYYDSYDDEFQDALELVNKYRASHAYPLNTFNANLRRKIKHKYNDTVVVAQRLKRMSSIIDKLNRFPEMQLSRMQDIGGLRIIFDTIDDVVKFTDEFKKSRFKHELVDIKDYISNPRDRDGYRSIHLIYKYNNNTDYDGLRLELQIRTKLQHSWATAVETMGLFLNQALKSSIGDPKWLNFFRLCSSAFALTENCKLIDSHINLNKNDIYYEISKANSDLSALKIMASLSIVTHDLKVEKKDIAWTLLKLDTMNQELYTWYFKQEQFDEANRMYEKLEAESASINSIIPVLVSTGDIKNLCIAYPNLFYDIGEFITHIKEIERELMFIR